MAHETKHYEQIGHLREGSAERCTIEVVKFSLNGGQGPHLRFILQGKCGRGGDRQEPFAVIEVFDGKDALGGERWKVWNGTNVEVTCVLAHFYVELRKRWTENCKGPVF